MIYLMSEILKVIERIRDSFDGSVEVYTQGSCVKFAMILKEIFPQGNILYNSDHAIFILEGRWKREEMKEESQKEVSLLMVIVQTNVLTIYTQHSLPKS